jgi:hypothetical protein
MRNSTAVCRDAETVELIGKVYTRLGIEREAQQ